MNRTLHRLAWLVSAATVTACAAAGTAPDFTLHDVMHRYIARFAHSGDGKIVGLTGTSQEVERVKTAYHIWSQKTPHDIAHTAVILLIDPHGRIIAVRDDSDSQESLAHAVDQMLPAS